MSAPVLLGLPDSTENVSLRYTEIVGGEQVVPVLSWLKVAPEDLAYRLQVVASGDAVSFDETLVDVLLYVPDTTGVDLLLDDALLGTFLSEPTLVDPTGVWVSAAEGYILDGLSGQTWYDWRVRVKDGDLVAGMNLILEYLLVQKRISKFPFRIIRPQ